VIRKWKSLSKLDCVKEFGLGHKIGHFLGIQRHARCMLVVGKWVSKGIKEGLEKEVIK